MLDSRPIEETPAATSAMDFDVFFEGENRRLFKAMVLVCGDCAEAEDVAQEAFVRVLERWDRVSLMEAPSAYLYRIALNERHSRLRRAVRRSRRSLFERNHEDPAAALALDRTEIGRTLMALPADQRTSIVLVEFVGLTSAEAGSVLGITAEAVRARISRGRTAIRKGRSDE
jgi:RNA polymerase sigma-70 factor (ECF subfamily)